MVGLKHWLKASCHLVVCCTTHHKVAPLGVSLVDLADFRDPCARFREAGFGEWTELILRGPDESELEAGEFKSGRRAKLEAAGYVIALTVGDQASDLSGGHSEATLLMPNPFYMVK